MSSQEVRAAAQKGMEEMATRFRNDGGEIYAAPQPAAEA